MGSENTFGGTIVPVITPLTSSYALDEAAVEKIVAHLHRHQAHAFILGTTGEAASLSRELKRAYVKKAAQVRKEGMQLYAGISSNCISESIAFAHYCADAGVDAVVATLPSYYALTEAEMQAYFMQLAASIELPLIVYNIPSTTHMSIPLPVADALSRHPNIVALKDSERSEERMRQALQLWKDRKDFKYFLGWAAQSANALMAGCHGLVPSTGNLLPQIYAAMWQAIAKGDREQAMAMQRLSDEYGNLYQGGRTLGQSLWALKVLMQDEALSAPYVMPPVQPMRDEEANKIVLAYRQNKNQQ